MTVGLISIATTLTLPAGAICFWNAGDVSGSSIPNRVSGASALTITNGTVSGGYLLNGSHDTLATLNTAQNAAAFTVMYLARHNGAPRGSFETMFSVQGDPGYLSLTVGPSVSFGGGIFYNGTQIDTNFTGVGFIRPDWWGGVSQGPFIGAARYDGAVASTFLNGVKLVNNAVVVSPPAPFTNIEVGTTQGTQHTTYDIATVVYWPRALSDAEIGQAHNFLARLGLTLTQPRTVVNIGTSITQGIGANSSYAYQMIPNLSPQAFGANYGVSGTSLGSWLPWAAPVDNILLSVGWAPPQKYILTVELGANDLGGGVPATFLSNLSAFCDARRAAGWKVVLHTVLARVDAGDGGALFNSDRHTVNAAIRTWVGTHCDAVADWAADATMGTDTAPNVGTSVFDAAIQSGGSGYTNGPQVLTVVGGTFTTAASFNVTVSGGAVTSINSTANAGAYSAPPFPPSATTGGGGTGCTLNVRWTGTYFSTQVHPTDLGHSLLAPITGAAVNSL